MQKKRFNFPVIYHRNRIYVFGGKEYGQNDHSIQKCCEYFDFGKKKWVSIRDMCIARSGHSAFVYRNKIWVLGGNNPYKIGSIVESYDVDSDTWTQCDIALPFDYYNHRILSIEKDKVLIVGGFTQNSVNQNIHEIDMKNQTIINKAQLSIKRQGFNLFYNHTDQILHIIGDDKSFVVQGHLLFHEECLNLQTLQSEIF